MKTPESQLTAEQPSTKKTQNYQKKDILYPKKKQQPQRDSRKGTVAIQWNPIPARWVTHRLENNYIVEDLSQEWQFWAPCQAPQPGGLAMRGGAPRAFGFEGQRCFSAESAQDWGKPRHHSWRVHTRFHVHWDPWQSSHSTGARARPTCGSWRVSWGSGGQLWLPVGARTLVDGPRNTHWRELSWRLPYWHWDLAPPNSLQAPVLGRLRQNNQKGGNTAPPISRQAV